MLQNQKMLFAFIAAGLMLSACSGSRPANLGIYPNGEFAPCPGTPNCVSSFAPSDNDRHYIEPINASDSKWQELARILESMPRIEIIERDGPYLRAEATTRILRFVDDLEFLYQPEQSIINIRSASRIGRYDFGVNRKRIENIRDQLTD